MTAGTPLVVDGSASTDPDGDPLVYRWDFGDGGVGGGSKLAHVFTAGGSYTVKLTVADGRGGAASATRTITVANPAAPGPAVSVYGSVGDSLGPLAGVTVQQVGGSVTGTTGADGKVTLSLPTAAAVLLKLGKSGYADQFVTVYLPAGAPSASFKAGMQPRAAAQPLNAATGGALAGADGARLTIGANALVDGSGTPVTGTVQVAITPVDVRGAGVANFPGAFSGVQPDGTSAPIASHGTVEFSLSAGGQKVQLAAGQTATIEIPIYAGSNLDGSDVAVGQQIPLWSLDERSGQWVQEGSGTVVTSTGPSGLAMRATVGHFSWWNSDAFITPPQPYNPLPRCFLNPGPEFTPIPKPCTIGPLLPGEYKAPTAPGRVSAAAVPAGFKARPAYSPRMDVPAAGGIALKVPAGVDFTFYACSFEGGVFCGTLTVNGAPGASADAPIELKPQTSTNCAAPTTVALPLSAQPIPLAAGGAGCVTFSVADVGKLTLSVDFAGLSGAAKLLTDQGVVIATRSGLVSNWQLALTAPGNYRIELDNASVAASGIARLTASYTAAPAQILTPPTIATLTLPAAGLQAVNLAGTAGTVYVGTAVQTAGLISTWTLASTTGGTSASGDLTYQYISALSTATASGTASFLLTDNFTNPSNGVSISFKAKPAVTLTAGTALADTISAATDLGVSEFVYAGTAGETLSLAARTDELVTGSTSLLATPYVRLFDPAGVELLPIANGSRQAEGTGGPNDLIAVLPTSGRYMIHFVAQRALNAGLTQGVGSYTRGLFSLASPQPLALTDPATVVSAAITQVGEPRGYSVNLAQGDVVRLANDITGGSLFPRITLRQPVASGSPYAGARVVSFSGVGAAAASAPVRIATAGLHLVQVAAESFAAPFTASLRVATGPFRLALLRPAVTDLAPDTPVSTPIPALGMTVYRVTIGTAGSYQVCARTDGSATFVTVFDGAGASVSATDGSGTLFALSPGEYRVAAYTNQNAAKTVTAFWRAAGVSPVACP